MYINCGTSYEQKQNQLSTDSHILLTLLQAYLNFKKKNKNYKYDV